MVDWRQHLEEVLEEDRKLLTKLENSLRFETNPKEQEKLKFQINELKQTINERQAEQASLSASENPKPSSPPPPSLLSPPSPSPSSLPPAESRLKQFRKVSQNGVG
ncbi:MAG: hypothetical protein HC866_20350 [Leptolyngbyaceae cyanobacterium RU_5_1]|nr:hypothetical protein [Leptolyngbyaceae cyanobacterium RU_5_1]